MGDNKIIQTHGKGKEKTGQDTGHDVRQHHLEKGIEGAGTEVQRRIIAHLRTAPYLRQHRKQHIREIKRDMGNENRSKTQGKAKGNEQQHQRDSRHDIRI